jgi:hypothetical protein
MEASIGKQLCFGPVRSSSSRKVLGLTPTAVFALATPKSLIDWGIVPATLRTLIQAFHQELLQVTETVYVYAFAYACVSLIWGRRGV